MQYSKVCIKKGRWKLLFVVVLDQDKDVLLMYWCQIPQDIVHFSAGFVLI